jgi:hypothetical protein
MFLFDIFVDSLFYNSFFISVLAWNGPFSVWEKHRLRALKMGKTAVHYFKICIPAMYTSPKSFSKPLVHKIIGFAMGLFIYRWLTVMLIFFIAFLSLKR